MKKKIIIVLSLLTVTVGGFFSYNYYKKTQTTNYKIDKLLTNMTLEEKIGQMLIVYYYSPECDDTLIESIKNYNLGGIILSSENIVNSKQLKKFVNDIQENSSIPMFISIDQEGGSVQRLKAKSDIKVSTIPSMAIVGEKNSKEEAYSIGNTIGKDLKTYGINMDFAPVLDINNPVTNIIGDRSFGKDFKLVSKMGVALSKGLIDNNIIPVFKHFPGLGDTANDSHLDLPILNKTKEELYDLELKPFIEAIENNADVIMIGHVTLPQLDKDNPATLSKIVITDLLKNELKYKGLIITDALNMKALTNYYSSEDIAVNAINAGVDILLMPGSSKSTVESVKNAIDEGKIKENQINTSVKKILKLKFKYNILEK